MVSLSAEHFCGRRVCRFQYFNPNHVHHRGISWMWPVVVVDGKTYDLWTVGEIRQRFVRWTKRESTPQAAVLGVENGWYIGERKVVNERVEIRAHPASGNARRLDFLRRSPEMTRYVVHNITGLMLSSGLC
jgi:hypothetical protein